MIVQHHLFSNAAYPVMAYVTACTGSALGLACARRFHARGVRRGWNWLAAGALTLGSGIWGMHFIAMLGFSVHGVELRYDVTLTTLSLIVAVVIVGLGMLAAGVRRSWYALLGSGLVSGLGVAAMHYIGMASLQFPGVIRYSGQVVLLSVLIAVIAATAALWATLRVAGKTATVAAATVMGIAISGMHYTGMLAVDATTTGTDVSGGGVVGTKLIAPLIIGLVTQILLVWFAVLMTSVHEGGDNAVPAHAHSASEVRPEGPFGN
ncbi:MHYT domain-containing protein [Streptomyces sp. 8N616]